MNPMIKPSSKPMMANIKLSLFMIGEIRLLSRLQQPANLFPQLRVVCVAVAGGRMIHRRFEHFFFPAFKAQPAFAVAGGVTPINVLFFLVCTGVYLPSQM